MRRVVLMAALAILGCGQLAPPSPGAGGSQFEDEAQELRYLKALANPTPEQFRRGEDLERKIRAEETLEALDRSGAEHHMARAHQRFEAGDLDAAIRECDEVLAATEGGRFPDVRREAEQTKVALLDLRETRRKAAGK